MWHLCVAYITHHMASARKVELKCQGCWTYKTPVEGKCVACKAKWVGVEDANDSPHAKECDCGYYSEDCVNKKVPEPMMKVYATECQACGCEAPRGSYCWICGAELKYPADT